VFTQLQNFKDAKYGNTQVKLVLQANELEEILTMGLSMPSIEFVTTTLEQILNRDSIASSDFLNFTKKLDDFLSDASTLVSLLSGSPYNHLCKLLVGAIYHLA